MNEKTRKKAELPVHAQSRAACTAFLSWSSSCSVYSGRRGLLRRSAGLGGHSSVRCSRRSPRSRRSPPSPPGLTDSADAAKVTGARPGELAGPHPAGGHRHPAARRHDAMRAVNEEATPSRARCASRSPPSRPTAVRAPTVFGTRRRRQGRPGGGLFHVHQLARFWLPPQLRRCRAHQAHHRRPWPRPACRYLRAPWNCPRTRSPTHLLLTPTARPAPKLLFLQRRGGHRRCAPCLVGGALLRLPHSQRLRQPGRPASEPSSYVNSRISLARERRQRYTRQSCQSSEGEKLLHLVRRLPRLLMVPAVANFACKPA